MICSSFSRVFGENVVLLTIKSPENMNTNDTVAGMWDMIAIQPETARNDPMVMKVNPDDAPSISKLMTAAYNVKTASSQCCGFARDSEHAEKHDEPKSSFIIELHLF